MLIPLVPQKKAQTCQEKDRRPLRECPLVPGSGKLVVDLLRLVPQKDVKLPLQPHECLIGQGFWEFFEARLKPSMLGHVP